MELDLEAALDKVVAGDCFKAEELPQPSEDERKPPKGGGHAGSDFGDLLEKGGG